MDSAILAGRAGIGRVAVRKAVLYCEVVATSILSLVRSIGCGPALGIHGAVLALRIGRTIHVENICVEELARLHGAAVSWRVGFVVSTLHRTSIGAKLDVERTRGEDGTAHITEEGVRDEQKIYRTLDLPVETILVVRCIDRGVSQRYRGTITSGRCNRVANVAV